MTNDLKIYFAGSIKGGREKQEEYLNLIEYLKLFGTVLTEHIGNKDVSIQNEKKYSNKEEEHVFIRDKKWIDESNILIAEVSIPSLGVGYELGYAESINKRIICLYNINSEKSLSYMISGNSKNEIIYYSTLEDVKEKLKNLLVDYHI